MSISFLVLFPMKGGSQNRTDGASAEECGGTGAIAERDPAERGMLRFEGSGGHGMGERIMFLLYPLTSVWDSTMPFMSCSS